MSRAAALFVALLPFAAMAADALQPATDQALFRQAVSGLVPGAPPAAAKIAAPPMDAAAIERGMKSFTSFNCVGCHADNGGGGMGPALSNRAFVYGDEPAQIYLTIVQGRPNGMPAWGTVLPDTVVWDIVAYVKSISAEPAGDWGRTVSAAEQPAQQVPAERLQTSTPWAHTQPFTNGQRP
jgi:cytochrome c oxidase cbb3-type subunit 3